MTYIDDVPEPVEALRSLLDLPPVITVLTEALPLIRLIGHLP